MKEIKLKERLENAFEAFFDNKVTNEKNSLQYAIPANIQTSSEQVFFSEKTQNIFNLLRQLFLFLPAAFLLFFVSIVLTAKFIFPLPEGVQRISFFGLMMLLGLILTTILGLGSLRNLKHFSIPLSIISLGVILGIIGTIFFDEFGFGYFLHNYVPYFFPLAFITPVLAKNWLDNSDDKSL